ncbi:transposase [Pseudomonas syringae]|uniref:transposase n=1 Tax=Pseudomonas syringae TaxID=317 RepID=UPI001269139F
MVPECLHSGVSMDSVCLRHGIHANLVRKWIADYRDCQLCNCIHLTICLHWT